MNSSLSEIRNSLKVNCHYDLQARDVMEQRLRKYPDVTYQHTCPGGAVFQFQRAGFCDQQLPFPGCAHATGP